MKKKYEFNKITGVDFSQEMLNLIPQNIYQNIELIDLNEKLKYKDNFYLDLHNNTGLQITSSFFSKDEALHFSMLIGLFPFKAKV